MSKHNPNLAPLPRPPLRSALSAVAVVVWSVLWVVGGCANKLGREAVPGTPDTLLNNTDSAYADYCISIEDSDTVFDVTLLLVKEYKNIEPLRLNTQKMFKCKGFSGHEIYHFDVIDKMIDELLYKFTFSKRLGGHYNGWAQGSSSGVVILNHVIPISHIYDLSILTIYDHNKKDWKKDMLPLKENLYTNVNVKIWRECPPYFDTTFQRDYRVRIVGECKSTKR
ncbi:hypothetical protein R80B4_02019 [Fibrobacteres bacterium R8-0-B4]